MAHITPRGTSPRITGIDAGCFSRPYPKLGTLIGKRPGPPVSRLRSLQAVAFSVETGTMTGEARETPILRGKLYPATGTRKPLPRPRLDSLSDVLHGSYPVVLVAAPAGYGKSTLMAQWHAHLVERGVPCAWLSVDENDDDKVRFVRHLIAALQHADARIGHGVAGGNLPGEFPSEVKSVLEALADELARVQQRIVLFLDDLHFVQ